MSAIGKNPRGINQYIEAHNQIIKNNSNIVWCGVTTSNLSEVILGFREEEKMEVLVNPSADKPACLVLID